MGERHTERLNKIAFLFKKVPELERSKLLLDTEALYSTTDQVTAEKVATIISKYISASSTIVDATACIGGSCYALAATFQRVIAIEKDHTKFEYLKHNMNVLGAHNIECINADCVNECKKYKSDAIFIDPPWGGPQYKTKRNVSLYLSEIPLSNVCCELSNTTKYIMLKVPTNFDETSFVQETSDCLELKHKNESLRKMNLLIFESKCV